jgi:molybdopterin synthase sulfur carrier subunit
MPLIKLFAGFRKAAGAKEVSIQASTLQEALDCILQQYPALQTQILEGAALRPHIILTINGQAIDLAAGLDISLRSEDQIAIFPPIAGGVLEILVM